MTNHKVSRKNSCRFGFMFQKPEGGEVVKFSRPNRVRVIKDTINSFALLQGIVLEK